jgi:hypothetical protein
MKARLNITSLVIGALIMLCIVLTVGASNRTSSTVNGRYQLALPGEGSNAYIIDTTTGQIWEKYPTPGGSVTTFRQPKTD